MSSKPLDDIWDIYQITKKSFKITLRSMKKYKESLNNNFVEFIPDEAGIKMLEYLLRKTGFSGINPEEAEKRIKMSIKDADDYVILSLWAVFERQLHEYLQYECDKMLDHESSFNEEVHKKFDDKMERWRNDDILDIFKTVVDSRLIGDAKNINSYRNWIAHRNIKKGNPGTIKPGTAYNVLSAILTSLEQNVNLSKK